MQAEKRPLRLNIMAFWTKHPNWVQNPQFTASPLLLCGNPPRCRITLDRQDFLHMVLFSSSKCNVSRLRKTSVYDCKTLASIKIVHKGVEVNFWKSIVFFVKEAAWLWQKEWVLQQKWRRQPVFSRCIHSSIFQRNYLWLTCRNFGQCGYQIEKESKMSG